MINKEDNPYEAPKTDLDLHKNDKQQVVDFISFLLVASIVAIITCVTLLFEYKKISSLCSLLNIKNEFGIPLSLVISTVMGLFVSAIIFFGLPILYRKINK